MSPRFHCVGLVLAAALSFAPSALRAEEKQPQAKETRRRVLLFAEVPASREYQFLLRHLQREEQAGRIEVVQCVQSMAGRPQPKPEGQVDPKRVEGQPPPIVDRYLDAFPSVLRAEKPEDKKELYAALASYDLVIVIDPDWTKLTAKQTGLLKEWVEGGGGLIFVAGPLYTGLLGHPKPPVAAPALLDVLPVVLEDERKITGSGGREGLRLSRLKFGQVADGLELRLKADAKDPFAGWDDFFGCKEGEKPERGFYGYYPVLSVKSGAKVFGTLENPDAIPLEKRGGPQPFLVAVTVGKGKSVYITTAETWRLRTYREEAHTLFWTALVKYAAAKR
jgi:hypothetical protein